jgi:23S rRNA (uracil1939-C5)-methyltransferase
VSLNCPVHAACGGCRTIGQPYASTLEQKQQEAARIYAGLPLQPILGMQDPYHYRHKIYASFYLDKARHVAAGLYEEETHQLIRSEDCLIQEASANRILKSVCAIATRMHLQPYNEDLRQGVLRHLYLRVSHSEKTVLMVLVTGTRILPGSREFVRSVLKENPQVKSIVLNFNDRRTSMVLGSEDRILYGPGCIYDSIGGIRFRISAHSFYQINPVMTETLYQTAITLAGLTPAQSVLDLCCGIGTISLLAAKQAQTVTGVEIVRQAVSDARANALANHIANARFLCQEAEQFLEQCTQPADVVFLDPPRSGFTESFLRGLARLAPARIVYISCNPETHVRDLAVLNRNGYAVRTVQPVDQFPFTAHLEAVSLLERVQRSRRETSRR